MSETKNSNSAGGTATEPEVDVSGKAGATGQANNSSDGPNTVKLTFLPSGQTVEFENGKLDYQEHGKPQSILDVAMNFGVKLDHACGGSCACTTCHVVVKKGKDLLNEMSEEEADRLDMAADLQLESRLGCQAVIEKPGEVVVEIPAWNRNYVSEEH